MEAVVEMTPSFERHLITYPTTEEMIAKAEKKFAEIPKDLTIKENYNFLKDGIKFVGKMITDTETRRKELKKKSLEYGREVDKIGNGIKDRLIAIRQPMKEKKVEFDTAKEIARREEERKEAERQEAIEIKILDLRNLVADNIQSDSAVLREILADLQKDAAFEWAEEHEDKVKSLSVTVIKSLKGLLNMKIQSEAAEKAEAEREAKEKERQKQQQIENARIAAKNKQQAEELRLAQARVEAEKAAIDEEKRKIAKKKQQADEAEKAAAQARVEAEKQAQIQKEEDEKKAKEEQRLAVQAKKEC